MEVRSPVSPIPGVVRPVEPQVFGRQALQPPAAPDSAGRAPTHQRRDRAAAAALTVAAIGAAADIVVRPILSPDTLPHPMVQWGAVAALAGTAIGVARGWRPARRVARVFGYVAGAGAFYAVSHFASFGSAAEWWVAALWSVEAISLGYVLQRLGWAGDEE